MATVAVGPSENDSDRQEYHRPRRPNPETLAYLKSLPLDSSASEEVQLFLSDGADSRDFPPMMAAALAAIDEIRHEVASLAGDEDGSEILEALIRIAVPYSELAGRALLVGTLGYCIHLATHRFGSHVLQTLLQLVAVSESKDDVALHKEAPPLSADKDLPELSSLLHAVHEELLPHVPQLQVHLCGSHVLRSLVCVFAGVQMKERHGRALRRGKQKKNKKKRALHASDGDGRAQQLEVEYIVNSRIDDAIMSKALQQMTDALSGTGVQAPGRLQQLSCHESAGPLLVILLRALTYMDAGRKWRNSAHEAHLEPKFQRKTQAYFLAERLLCWQSKKDKQEWAGEVIYGLAGEPRGSHVLETIFKLCPDSLFESIFDAGGFKSSAILKEYAMHDVSNFVLQSLLLSLRNKEQVSCILQAMLPLIADSYIVEPSHKRRGVLWRVVEQASKNRVCQKEIITNLQTAFASKSLKDSAAKLLLMRRSTENDDRIVLDVPGSHIVYHLLKFDAQFAKPILESILRLSKDDLESLAKDSLGSRCVWDGVLEGAERNSDFAAACSTLLSKMSERWVAIATHRVGHHVVINLFKNLHSMEDRKRLVEELSTRRSRLNGCAMGRSVMEACLIREFSSEGEERWVYLVKEMTKTSDWLRTINHLGDGTPTGSADKRRKRTNEDNDDRKAMKPKGVTDSIATIMDVIKIRKEAI